MAPEMLSGQGGVTSKIDVHSFGMLLFALVNGSEPYEGSYPPNLYPHITRNAKIRSNDLC